ncbi:hypothetical protein CJF42_22450 [Pseudoalteromonas sp. NBT06-2]|nr:hypothetical protein CJF42_22450 [Pseudoalteromonas sp. NBT06-2]
MSFFNNKRNKFYFKTKHVFLNLILTLLFCTSLNVYSFSFTEQKIQFNHPINTNIDKLCKVANSTKNYLNKGNIYDPKVIHSNVLTKMGITSAKIKQSLSFICKVHKEDLAANRPERLLNPDFIQRNFKFINWKPDTLHAQKLSQNKKLLINLPKDKILMTKYYIHQAKARLNKSKKHPYALYKLPLDESNLTLEQAQENTTLTRYKYTKQEILKGVLDSPKQAEPLIFLSRKDLESSLMQGTVVADVNGEKKVFNVHRNNGMGYDRKIKPYEQNRYWYFKQVQGILGYGKDANNKVTVIPEVTFAGDIYKLGLGHLLFTQFDYKSHSEYKMAILADTGGAFENNLYQLDYLSGSYGGFKEYAAANRHLPDYISVWFMLLK